MATQQKFIKEMSEYFGKKIQPDSEKKFAEIATKKSNNKWQKNSKMNPIFNSKPVANPKSDSIASKSSAAPMMSLQEKHNNNLNKITTLLEKSRFWHLLPTAKSEAKDATSIYDTQTGLIYPTAQALRDFLTKNPFVYVQSSKDKKNLATFHTTTRLLWNHETSNAQQSPSDGKIIVENARWAGLEGWRLPKKDMLWDFATAPNNPHRKGNAYRLANFSGNESLNWLTVDGSCYIDNGYWGESNCVGFIFACNELWEEVTDNIILSDLVLRNWYFFSSQGQTFATPVADTRWRKMNPEELLAALEREKIFLQAIDKPSLLINPEKLSTTNKLVNLDYVSCRLPVLNKSQLSDPEKGIWELWGEDKEFLNRIGLVARDPARDVKNPAVAIDFGTSSTVVAVGAETGQRQLLRIGVRDFFQPPEPHHFENPTALEFLDINAWQSVWNQQAYRPALDWAWVRAAHEAQESFRDNTGDTQVLASILHRLKQWARRSEQERVRITDRQGQELELPSYTERNPVRGLALEVSPQDPFDPIELYAWYLGMAINWRGHGLFLKYYLSFPVKYQREIKECILASFRRGLQRSLPASLISRHPETLHNFEVLELASEPAAYAAAALPHLGIEPSEEGVPYAVFDFGGGTTDFDFGLLRWATTEEEDDEGCERVFEHYASSGDNALGGEHLLEQLVYASFQHNLPVLREKRIQFTKPLEDAHDFAGSEAFLAPTQAAQTNSVMLAAKLRPFLEDDSGHLEASQIKLDLIDVNGQKQTCVLALDAEALDTLLLRRMREGVEAFLAELANVREQWPAAAPIHILLAGNGSRSRHIKALFDGNGPLWPQLLALAFGETDQPEMVLHEPLPIDHADPYAPTAKTGVALGLLCLAPGEGALLRNHVQEHHNGQAPFGWFVGKMRRGQLVPVLTPGTDYKVWHELGPLQQGVFNLCFSTSPRARQGLAEGDPALNKYRMDFPAASAGAKLFARAILPHVLELAAASDLATLDESTAKRLDLD